MPCVYLYNASWTLGLLLQCAMVVDITIGTLLRIPWKRWLAPQHKQMNKKSSTLEKAA